MTPADECAEGQSRHGQRPDHAPRGRLNARADGPPYSGTPTRGEWRTRPLGENADARGGAAEHRRAGGTRPTRGPRNAFARDDGAGLARRRQATRG